MVSLLILFYDFNCPEGGRPQFDIIAILFRMAAPPICLGAFSFLLVKLYGFE
jgi:hypothetical protein